MKPSFTKISEQNRINYLVVAFNDVLDSNYKFEIKNRFKITLIGKPNQLQHTSVTNQAKCKNHSGLKGRTLNSVFFMNSLPINHVYK